MTTAPALNRLVLASQVNSDGSPQNEVGSIPSNGAGTIYACAQVSHVTRGQTVIAVWSRIGGDEVNRSEQDVTGNSAERWIALSWQPSGVESGTYAVTIYVDQIDGEHQLNSLAFRIG